MRNGTSHSHTIEMRQMITSVDISHEDRERISAATDKFEESVLNSGAARIFFNWGRM